MHYLCYLDSAQAAGLLFGPKRSSVHIADTSSMYNVASTSGALSRSAFHTELEFC